MYRECIFSWVAGGRSLYTEIYDMCACRWCRCSPDGTYKHWEKKNRHLARFMFASPKLYRARTHSFDCRFSHAGLASLFICRIEFLFFRPSINIKKVYIVRYWYINFIILTFFLLFFLYFFHTACVLQLFFIHIFFLSGATNNNTSIPLFSISRLLQVSAFHTFKKIYTFLFIAIFFLYFFFIACSFFLISTRGESQKLAKLARLSSKNFCLSPRIAIFLLQANRDLVSGNFL